MLREDTRPPFGRRGTGLEATAPAHVEKTYGGRGIRSSSWHLYFGAIWGGLLGLTMTYLNQRYDTLFANPDAVSLWAMAGLVFFLVSLAALAIMVVVGLIYALMGRSGRRRWSVILMALLFLAPGNFAARAVLGAS